MHLFGLFALIGINRIVLVYPFKNAAVHIAYIFVTISDQLICYFFTPDTHRTIHNNFFAFRDGLYTGNVKIIVTGPNSNPGEILIDFCATE